MPNRLLLNPFLVAGVLFAALAFVALPASGDSVVFRLRNGDRLTGDVLFEGFNGVVVNTPWAKEIVVPYSEIISREQAVVKSTNAVVEPKSPVQIAAEPPKTNGTAGVVASGPATKKESKFTARKSWHGKVDLGMDLGFSETTRELFYGKAKITYAPETAPGQLRSIAERFRNTFEYQATYGKTEGVLSANRMDGSSKTDFDIGKNIFVYNLIGLGYDEIRKIDFQYEVGPGIGYHLFKRTNFVMDAEFGFNYQVQNLQGNASTERFFTRFAENATWNITKRLSWDEKVELFPSLDLNSFRARLETNVRYSLLDNLSLTLSILDIYDTEPAAGVGKNDLQIRSMIGVSF